ncbi:protealysin inhibitor emfourin [Arthrobacter sp. Soc17.1.1.1]|uniref:protealysin inhibitor emfourin n=1 Tax=Arthrobacter sp. Soc17.1.1.1 TaxID=3121277 RepID=UPI002FE49E2E
MRIEITRSGGFGGLTRTWSLEVSRTEAEQRWLPLAEAEAAGAPGDTPGDTPAGTEAGTQAGSSAAAAPRGAGRQRDRFTYRIAIGYTEVHLSESHLGDPWRELIDRARAAAAPDPGKPEELL